MLKKKDKDELAGKNDPTRSNDNPGDLRELFKTSKYYSQRDARKHKQEEDIILKSKQESALDE